MQRDSAPPGNAMSCSPPFLVRLRQASVQRGGRLALHVEAFDLLPGQHWAILGGNGTGKSTFLKLLRGELWPLAPRHEGQISRLYGFTPEPTTAPLVAKGRMPLVSAEMQLQYQQRAWRITALEAVLAGMFDANLLYQKAEPRHLRRAEECLRRLDAAHLAERPLPGLSQGELRRVLVARALAACGNTPAVLLLDEVCDGLDPEARTALLAGLEQIMRLDSGVQLVCTSHRSEELPRGLTHTALCEDGRLASQKALAMNTPLPSRRDEERVSAAPDRQSSEVSKALDALLADHAPYLGQGEIILNLRGVDVFRQGTHILRDITWRMRQGEHWAIIGDNGAGKSTLLKLICAELHPACVLAPAGTVERNFGQRRLEELRRRIGLVAPHLDVAWDYPASAQELVASGLDARIGLHGLRPAPEQLALAVRWLRAFGLEELRERPFTQLSSGQRRRCFLARAMLAGAGHGPALLLLDEPYSGLDAPSRGLLREILGRLASAGVPLLLATHHREDMPDEITHVLILRQGRILAQGSRQELLPDEAESA